MRKILDWLNASGGYGWLLLGSLLVWGLGLVLVNRAHAYSNHDALQASESRSYACREYAEGVRVLAESRDQGGSIGPWLSVAETQAWADLVVSVWDSGDSPADLFALHYAECVRGGSWEVES